MTNNSSYYHALNGQFVIVNTRASTFLGKLETDTFDTLVLRPSVVHEPSLHMNSGDMKNVPHYRLETERPTIINTMEVQTVQPTTEEHVRHIVNYDSGKYEPKFPKKEGEKK
jgi:hypothetical protein